MEISLADSARSELACVTISAPAKINLTLDVIGKKENGYHLVEMIMQSVALYDEIMIERVETLPGKEAGITLLMPGSDLPTGEGNIAYRAARYMMDRYAISQSVKITIHKNIPIAAGLAGGSTDAAGVMRGMDQLFAVGMTKEESMELALRLGADVAFCLQRNTALATGIGEVLEVISSPPQMYLLIAKPDLMVSTAMVYQRLSYQSIQTHPDTKGMVATLFAKDYDGICKRLCNVLETVTIPMHPVIDAIKQQMLKDGADAALMSGSGPTVFGIYPSLASAERAKEALLQSGLVQVAFVTTPE